MRGGGQGQHLSTTMRHYGHWADEELAAAFEMLAAIRERR